MKHILVGIIVVIGLVVFLFGGSMPTSFYEIRNGDYELKIKPLFGIGPIFTGFDSGKGMKY